MSGMEENLFKAIQLTERYDRELRAKAIDEFADRLKERLTGMQMAELQGEVVCPCSESGEYCPYINQDIGCQYCAREQTIKDIDEIAEQLKKVASNERNTIQSKAN